MSLQNVIPILRSFDEAKTKEFYVGFLGFTIDFEHRFEPGLPLYMQVSKEGCVLHLSGHPGDCTPGAAIRIETTNIEEFQKQLMEKHYEHARPGIEDMPWHTREMRVWDPSGNRLIFNQPINAPSTSQGEHA